MIEGELFWNENKTEVNETITHTLVPLILAPWRVQKSIDMKVQGSLNDTACCDIYHIEKVN